MLFCTLIIVNNDGSDGRHLMPLHMGELMLSESFMYVYSNVIYIPISWKRYILTVCHVKW